VGGEQRAESDCFEVGKQETSGSECTVLDVRCLDWQQANPARERRRNGRQKIVYSLAREEEMGGRR